MMDQTWQEMFNWTPPTKDMPRKERLARYREGAHMCATYMRLTQMLENRKCQSPK